MELMDTCQSELIIENYICRLFISVTLSCALLIV